MSVAVETTSGMNTLAQLETVVRQTETIMGPLCTLGAGETNDTPVNLMSFEVAAIPDTPLLLEEVPAGESPSKPGHSLVCVARAFVRGQLTAVAVFRPT